MTVFFNLRIDDTLNEKLMVLAENESRSKNKEIEFILKDYIRRYEEANGTLEVNQSGDGININQSNNTSANVKIKK